MSKRTGDDLLNERLQGSDNRLDVHVEKTDDNSPATPEQTSKQKVVSTFDFVQWSAEPNETFRPSGQRRETLAAGVYTVGGDDRGLYFQRKQVLTDKLIELDDAATVRVIDGIRTFWDSKQEYARRGIVYKRGILLWGPAGSGKTATLMLLTHDLVAKDGIVILCDHPGMVNAAQQVLRRIEPERPLIVIMEDIDELIGRYGEHDILALLDGESQINNVVNIATTNYPERLGARIVNRPSRFDERIFIDMPCAAARRKYLLFATRDESITEGEINQWVRETDNFSIAHLRELVVAVFCLKQKYADVVERLGKMRVQPKGPREFGDLWQAGFGGVAKARKGVFVSGGQDASSR